MNIHGFALLPPGEPAPDKLLPIWLHPSPAGHLARNRIVYGQGWHKDTQWFLGQVERYVRPGMRVLDFGAGTGILAIAAARKGAEVTACEILPEARELIDANATLNDVAIELTEIMPDGPFDLILCNMGEEGRQYETALRERLAPGGRLLWQP